jgi:hypothetical protein
VDTFSSTPLFNWLILKIQKNDVWHNYHEWVLEVGYCDISGGWVCNFYI